ncbi:MAG: hypothetical protein CBE09_01755 [Rhizobiales bacterium TMED249]|nr:MAG: hypothetical protein CBE09_01755 [Rhizobiales bacterium TMED249]HAK98083.1 hypothetical protein [Rhodobiaceae bacterium]HCV48779.1 hypothetical protein [Rhodobiaceae bacterium]
MKFCFICWDKPDQLRLRASTREAHLTYLKNAGNVFFAGPFMSEEYEADEVSPTPIGSMLVIEAKDREAAENWAASDPYAIAGLFDSVEIHPWNHSFGSLPKA